jgi:hypothetical protein
VRDRYPMIGRVDMINMPNVRSRGSSTMLELFLCSLVTLLPDYLYRRYVQGKRLGKEITFYSVWFELRWASRAASF